MRERFDFLFAQGVGDVGHDSLAAADTRAGLVAVHRLQQLHLALAGEAGDTLGAGEIDGVTRGAAAPDGSFRAFLR